MDLIDFHTHIASPGAFLCCDSPATFARGGLVDCVGLLPALLNEQTESSFFSLLESDPSLWIGEVGLDRRFVSSCPIEVQEDFLRRCLSTGRPVQLHCVRETGRLVSLLEEFDFGRKPHSTCIWHGFSGSIEIARRLVSMGVWLSVGPRCLEPAGYGLPFLIETDWTGTDAAEYARALEKQYTDCAALCGVDFDTLKETMYGRAKAFKDNGASR